jgi:Family of unknown function (DUF6370)
MKAVVTTVLAMVMVFAIVAGIAIAADDKEVTISGTITCAKCDLKKEKACATVIVEKKGDKETVYYFDTDSHKKNHKMVCTEAKKGSVTGVVADKDGKKTITVKTVKFD